MVMQVWVRNGWRDIVKDAATRLSRLDVDVLEAREKLGQLRIHVPAKHVRRPEVQAIFREAADRASRTCDLCGAPGRLRKSPALAVRCDQHERTDTD